MRDRMIRGAASGAVIVLNDVNGAPRHAGDHSPRPEPTLHVRRPGDLDPDHRAARDPAHALDIFPGINLPVISVI